MRDVRAEAEHVIASQLDRPSVYMAPSPPSRRRAREIIDALAFNGLRLVADGIEELAGAVPVSEEEASAPRSAQLVKLSRGALISKRAVLRNQIDTCKLDDLLDCPCHRDARRELETVDFLLGEEAIDGQR